MRRASILLLIAACGGTSSGPPPAQVQAAISAVAPRASEADLEVARVAGRPVWASCLVEQATRHQLTREQALDQCIAFELMAQEAERRGLTSSPEVAEATRTSMVSRLVATAFEDAYRTPADLGELMESVVEKNAWRMHRPDVRASSYVRVAVPKQAAPEVEAQARVTAQAIADALATEAGLSDPNFLELAQRAAAGATLEHSPVAPTVIEKLDKAYGDALYRVPEIGRTTGPVRTPWGYDVILWSGGLPPKETSRAELEAEMFQEVRRAYFSTWVTQVIKKSGIQYEVHPERIPDDGDAP
ncbi:MAG TPA: hypothetical protein VM513_05005 [Kofleriaceae bacterium]|nr:hypothetical protein [Kofleriaceae bacterium]